MQNLEILNSVVKSIVEGDKEKTVDLISKALESGLDSREILENGVVKGAEEVGNLYEKAEIYLPELLLSGDAMTAAVDILKQHLEKAADRVSKGLILIGTPEGDIHSIGKNIISALLQAQGFDVIDLGTDVAPSKFVEKAKEIKPHIIGLSGLMTITLSKMQETIVLLREANIDSKIILGGGIITENFCKLAGADDYTNDGWDGIKKIKKLIELKTRTGTKYDA
jgi:5-methyltetrahydrofolate--homocysteine methyltransferase